MTKSRVVIVGGGLAGLAGAVALATRGCAVTLLESRPRWGGRASSFTDQTTGETIDNCQHVAMGCCTNFLEFCRQTGLLECFRRESRLYFIGPDGVCNTFSAAPFPAPLHLGPAFLRLSYLTWKEKCLLALGLKALARERDASCEEPMSSWLERHGQTPRLCEYFWHVVLVSALSESLDRMHVAAARKVFVDGFLAHREGWEVWLPVVPLDQLYGTRLAHWLHRHGVEAQLSCGAAQVQVSERRVRGVTLRSGEFLPADHILLAVSPRRALDLLEGDALASLENNLTEKIQSLQTAPISSVHLWFDRPLTRLPHATLVGRLSQWMFNRSPPEVARGEGGSPAPGNYYYQVVISASRMLAGQPQAEVIAAVVEELGTIWPTAREARLKHARLVTEHQAVLSMLPGVEPLRPAQRTEIPNLHLAGDWTQTGWPGTMEGAVRSGWLAAENILRELGRHEPLLQPGLPTAVLSKLCFGL